MLYVIYRKSDFYLWKNGGYCGRIYFSESAAKSQLTKHSKGPNAQLNKTDWAVMEYSEYRATQPEIEVTSLRGGVMKIKAEHVGEPAFDPSFEEFWVGEPA